MSIRRPSIAFALTLLTLVSCGEKSSSVPPDAHASAPASPVAHAAAVVADAASVRSLKAGCAGCVFHMAGAEGCQLAVEIDGKPYLVSGVDMPGHESGLCDHARTADIAGKLEGDRFVAASFMLKP